MEKLRETAEAHGVFFTKHYHLTRQTDFSRSQDDGLTDKHEKFSGESFFTLLHLLTLGEGAGVYACHVKHVEMDDSSELPPPCGSQESNRGRQA